MKKTQKPKSVVKAHIKSFLQYEFSDEATMIESITHRSAGKENYERFEFLGDAVIQLVITELLLQRYHKSNEGELSRMRQSLVNRSTLSKIALELQLEKILISYNLSIDDNASLKKSITAELFESIIGGIYIDSNYQKCKKIISKVFDELIETNSIISRKDSKTKLQEYLQAKNLPLPEYKKNKIKSPDHNPRFKITCKISLSKKTFSAISSTVKEGEQSVAQKILEQLIDER
tara:strand:- start:4324 stop:5022 length:699 start_codon:yes stop_codon:yes gene_type:complete